MVYLIAGNYRQALHYAREKNLGKPNEDWTYISSEQDLLGLYNPLIIRLGNWHTHNHADEIIDVVEARNFEILESNF